jgi:hypothetical protein
VHDEAKQSHQNKNKTHRKFRRGIKQTPNEKDGEKQIAQVFLQE